MLIKDWRGLEQLRHEYIAQEIVVYRKLPIATSAAKVFDFLADVSHWTCFTFHGLNQLLERRSLYEFESRFGPGYLICTCHPQQLQIRYTILYEHEDAYEGCLQIESGERQTSVLTMALTKPGRMPCADFRDRLLMIDRNLNQLKSILEA